MLTSSFEEEGVPRDQRISQGLLLVRLDSKERRKKGAVS